MELKGELLAIRDAAGWEQGKELAQGFIARYRDLYPLLVKCLEDDLEATLAHLRVPFRHRRHVRTTKLVERTSRRWKKVSFSAVEIARLDALRRELGIEEPRTETEAIQEVC